MTISIGFGLPAARPPQNGSDHSTVRGGCPSCSQDLRISWDMWGQFYVCDGCGFAAEDDDELMIGADVEPPKRGRLADVSGHQERSPSGPSLVHDLAMLAGLYGMILWMLLQRLRYGKAWQYRFVQSGSNRPAWNS